MSQNNSRPWFGKILYYMLHLIFGSSSAYSFRPGDSVLVIEVGKDFVKYFKLTKPEKIKSIKSLSKLKNQEENGGTFLNVRSLLPPKEQSSSNIHQII